MAIIDYLYIDKFPILTVQKGCNGLCYAFPLRGVLRGAPEESGEGKLLMRVLGGSSMASSVCLYTADHHSSQGSS